MPAPAVYILLAVGTVAAGFAFKEFVWEPHIAPKVERWAEDFLAKRKARRQERSGPILVPVRARPNDDNNNNNGPDSKFSRSRTGTRTTRRRSDSNGDDENTKADRESYELEKLVAKEVHEWRSEVGRSQEGLSLRHRKQGSSSSTKSARTTLDETNTSIPYAPMSPTHVIFDPSVPSTPSSGTNTGRVSPVPRAPSTAAAAPPLMAQRPISRSSTLRSPVSAAGNLPTPDSSVAYPEMRFVTISPLASPQPTTVVSLSMRHEHDLELLSAPSSRPSSRFSNFSTVSHPALSQASPRSSNNASPSPFGVSQTHSIPTSPFEDLHASLNQTPNASPLISAQYLRSLTTSPSPFGDDIPQTRNVTSPFEQIQFPDPTSPSQSHSVHPRPPSSIDFLSDSDLLTDTDSNVDDTESSTGTPASIVSNSRSAASSRASGSHRGLSSSIVGRRGSGSESGSEADSDASWISAGPGSPRLR